MIYLKYWTIACCLFRILYLSLCSCGKQGAASQQTAGEGTGVFSRFRFLNQKAPTQGDNALSCHKIDLRTSTIKIDAEENDLRFCFRVISPMKAYTLQVIGTLLVCYSDVTFSVTPNF